MGRERVGAVEQDVGGEVVRANWLRRTSRMLEHDPEKREETFEKVTLKQYPEAR